MLSTISPVRYSSRTDRPFSPGRRHCVNFAREMTLAEFGPRDGRALLQADFIDRQPWALPAYSPEAPRR